MPQINPTPTGKGVVLAPDQNAALNVVLPPQTGNAGKVLETDGTDASWQTPAGGAFDYGKMLAHNLALRGFGG